jgi:hypothetical protein
MAPSAAPTDEDRGVQMPASGGGMSGVSWRKASYSGQNGHCVEAAAADGTVYVRDSKDPHGPVLGFTREEWYAFLDGAKKGEFDSLI